MPLCEAPCNVNLTGAMMDSPHLGIANSVLMFDTVQTKYDLNDRLFLSTLKEGHYEYEYKYRSRTLTGLAIPGVGPLIAAGPIMGALSGAAVGAATGGLAGALIGLGIPEYEAKRYEGKIVGGSALISVHTESSEGVDKAKKIFEEAHAEDISSTGEESV